MIKHLLRFIRHTFDFSYSEARGFLLMAVLLMLFAITYLLYRNLPEEGYTSFKEDKRLLDSLVVRFEALEQRNAAVNNPSPFKKASSEKKLHFFSFDPNRLSADSLQMLGIPAWLARRIANYRRKGGVFHEREDLLRIYDFPDSLYDKLQPYIQIKKAAPKVANKLKERKPAANPINESKERRATFDLNAADSLQLQQIKGIGPVLSARIVRFRQVLGGFVREQQLYEVYGLDSLVAGRLMEHSTIAEDFKPAQIRLNSGSVEELMAHPYISPAQARLLMAYREQHGPFEEVDDLLKIHTIDIIFVRKIAPYISLD